jgi:hypothetical protein
VQSDERRPLRPRGLIETGATIAIVAPDAAGNPCFLQKPTPAAPQNLLSISPEARNAGQHEQKFCCKKAVLVPSAHSTQFCALNTIT